jgi:hypothetical protein
VRATELAMHRGDAAAWAFTVRQPDGTAQDLTGLSARFTAKRRVDDADGAAGSITRTVGSGITVTDAAAGTLVVELAAADTDALTTDTTLVWDLQLTGAGKPRTVAWGTLVVRADIGRTAP